MQFGFAATLKSQHAIKKNRDSRLTYVQNHFSTVQVQLVVRDKAMGKLAACKILLYCSLFLVLTTVNCMTTAIVAYVSYAISISNGKHHFDFATSIYERKHQT